MSSLPPLQPATSKCWFCQHCNPSYLAKCEECKALITPTRTTIHDPLDPTRGIIKWISFSFESMVAATDRGPGSLSDALRVFHSGKCNVAIRLAKGEDRTSSRVQHMLIGYMNGTEIYQVGMGQLPEKREWDHIGQTSFFNFGSSI